MARTTYKQDPETKKYITAAEFYAKYPPRNVGRASYVQGDMESFVSPIDGSVLSDRSHLREHNRRHGVTNVADYSQAHFDKAHVQRGLEIQGKTRQAKTDRVETIKKAMAEHGL